MSVSSQKLRAVFLGTPEFALPSLLAVHRHTELLAVVTQPDRPQGRGRQVAPPPVARKARELGVRVFQPARLKDASVIHTIRDLNPDIIVTVAYGKIIPRELLEVPPLGCINLHPSLLPRYRGAAPIQAAIAAGERETGVTIMYQTDELDAGDIILQRRVPIAEDDTGSTLEDKLALFGAEALVEAIRLIAAGDAPRSTQDVTKAIYVKKLTKEHGRIDWARPADELERLIRAMNPWPSAFTSHHGKLLKIWKARVTGDGGIPGVIHDMRRENGFVVGTGSGSLVVLEVQPEGGRRMSADEYTRGYQVKVGDELGKSGRGSSVVENLF